MPLVGTISYIDLYKSLSPLIFEIDPQPLDFLVSELVPSRSVWINF